MNRINRKQMVVGTAVIIALVLIVSLFVIRIGVADNGMQYKLLEKLGLYDAYQTSGTGYYSEGYGIADKSFSGTTYGLIYDFAKQFFAVDTVLFTALPAIIYLLIFVLSAMLIIYTLYSDKFVALNWISFVLLILVFCDSAYIAYFNTPYKNAAFFVYFIATLALFINTVKTKKILPLIFFGIFGCLFGGVSVVSSVTAIILGVFALRIMSLNSKILWKITTAVLCLAIVTSGVAGILSNEFDYYDSVFYGAALEDDSAIEKLGLDVGLKEYSGVPSFDEKAQQFINSSEYNELFYSKISIGKVLEYYIKNVPDFYKGIKKVAYNSTSIRTSYLGGYTASTGKASQNSDFFTIYSSVKSKAFPGSVIVFLIVLGALVVVSFTYRNNYAKNIYDKLISEFCAVIAIATAITYPLPYLFNGMTQIGFNMFEFNLMFDVCVYMLVLSTVNLLMTKKNILKEKYGVNQ